MLTDRSRARRHDDSYRVADVIPRFILLGAVTALLLGASPASARQAEGPSEPTVCIDGRALPSIPVTGPEADLARLGQLTGALPIRLHAGRRMSGEPDLILCAGRVGDAWLEIDDTRPLLTVLPVRARVVSNSAYPRSVNDGALWAGRGWGALASGGVRLRWGIVSAAIAPEYTEQRNRPFEIREVNTRDLSSYSYPYRPGGIDWPQRFGEDPIRATLAGQSYLRVDAFGLAVGVSNENLWWGPAQRYPLLMSNNAPGFPHVFMGTGRPIDIRIGTLEFEASWGRLEESQTFDSNPENDRRLFAGLVVGFSPKWLPGLSIGAARSFVSYYDHLTEVERLMSAYHEVRNNPAGRGNIHADNQLLSLFGRWAVPAAGLEVYGEVAREDHWADFQHLIAAPDMSQAYMLGFQQVVPARGGLVRITGELVQLEDAHVIYHAYRHGPVRYYTHSQIVQGYTHRGQLLGAWIGPDANAQFLAADHYSANGSFGGYVERVRRGADSYSSTAARRWGSGGHDLELTAGFRLNRYLGLFNVSGAVAYSHRSNRSHLGLLEDEPSVRVETNWAFDLGLAMNPERILRLSRTE